MDHGSARASSDAERIARLLGDWRGEHAPANRALSDALAELIDGAYLPAGWRMPGQRELAAVLGVARGTVSRAYVQLAASRRLTGRVGSGTFVRGSASHLTPGEGRLASFDSDRVEVDLSSGALPGSDLVPDVMTEVGRLIAARHLAGSGYHPAGLPELRAALAAEISGRGVPTSPDQVMVTAGSQQAVWLIASVFAGPGTRTVVEDPTYRGALEAFAASGTRLVGIPFRENGVDVDALGSALPRADLLYVQSSLHNPTGAHSNENSRRAIAALVDRQAALVVDDQSQADLARTRSSSFPGLEKLVDPERLLVLGTLSKLFWGGLRVGWIRGPRELVARLSELRRGIDLGSPVADQLAALLLMPRIAEQRDRRREFLAANYARTTAVLESALPSWRWWLPAGGSGLWVDTGHDAVSLAQRALTQRVKITAGTAFSPHGSHRNFVRLPIWQPPGQLERAARALGELVRSSDGTIRATQPR